jgi:hypothetical protein
MKDTYLSSIFFCWLGTDESWAFAGERSLLSSVLGYFLWLLADERFLFCYSDFYIPNSIDHILIAENVNVLL